MNIGSTADTSLSQLLSQLKASTTASTTASTGASTGATSSATTQVATSSASTTTSVAENSDFFLNQLSASIMGSLLSGISQASQTAQASLTSDTSQTSLMSHKAHSHRHGGHHKSPSPQDMDTDGNGSLSNTSKADALFAKMDTNGDGSVSASEKSAFDQQMAANRPDGPPPGDAQGQPSTDGTSQVSSGSGTGNSSTDLASLMHELVSALQSYSASQGTATSAASSTLSIAA